MWVRMSRFAGLPPERIDQTIRDFEEGQLPALEQQQGFQGVLVGVDRGEGKAAAMTFWETRESLTASDKLADRAREAAVATAQPDREPIVDRYEVVLEKQPPGAQ
jgi:heme-degrading monooxygenase HmoA